MKITSSKSKTVKSLLEMFLEMLITHSDPKPKSTNNSSSVVNRALDLLNRFILNPSITGDYSLESMLTLFYCLQAIELCRSLLLEGQNDRPLHPTRSLSERDSYERRKKHQKTLVTTLLKEANVNNILLLAPSSAEICSRPLLFAQTISTLRLYDAKYTK